MSNIDPLTEIQLELLTISKSKKVQLGWAKNGPRLEKLLGSPLDQVMKQVCVDRLRLAENFLVSAERFAALRPPEYRNSVSRAYYALYHAARVLAYAVTDGDDHEKHDIVHNAMPSDFVDREKWQNAIKDARAHRNDADYDPYPTDEEEFRDISKELRKNAADFMVAVKAYLQPKGYLL